MAPRFGRAVGDLEPRCQADPRRIGAAGEGRTRGPRAGASRPSAREGDPASNGTGLWVGSSGRSVMWRSFLEE